ncbi:aldose epimerase family protein [Rubellimicrobium roseum]|uniref:Aldose 1-epimerase n=1 Tax=Rubellimicrobium roseum TaxID=687525 RepID=A0A5C4NGB9_9RHOB|nr:aldose epimerase family protein [Rubellimicrobium roseum]TNC73703.1 galactose mutarotase [Rubellimicrobium roseum]
MAVEDYGRIGNDPVQAVTLVNGPLRARLITYGARLTELHVPDREGRTADIVLGHDTLAEYEASKAFFGATAGRYANRIRRGRFHLDGRDHQLDVNEGPNHLHGGRAGFDRANWRLDEATETRAVLSLISPDGDMGYPGACHAVTTYELADERTFRITMTASASAPTPVNIVHHSYFNLAGQGDVLGQELRLDAPFYTPVDAELLATGEILSVAGTPFDFTTPKPIGRDFAALGAVGEGVFDSGGGYDHNWVLAGAGEAMRLCAEARDPASGRRMRLLTNQPGVQLYTGGYLNEQVIGKGGRPLQRFAGFTLETQVFPGSPNHAHFPSSILRPRQTYDHRMEFDFSAD